MYKKAWCACKVIVLQIKPIVFLTFSLPSASLDLKVPNAKQKRAQLLRSESHCFPCTKEIEKTFLHPLAKEKLHAELNGKHSYTRTKFLMTKN